MNREESIKLARDIKAKGGVGPKKIGLSYFNFPSVLIENITFNVIELSSDKMNSYSPFF